MFRLSEDMYEREIKTKDVSAFLGIFKELLRLYMVINSSKMEERDKISPQISHLIRIKPETSFLVLGRSHLCREGISFLRERFPLSHPDGQGEDIWY